MKDAVDARSARDVFPAGLEQPEGSFRFSADALLLAKFTAGQALPENAVLAELGTGCGVVSLAVLLEKYTYNQIIRMPVWVLTRVFQANWKQMYELSSSRFSSEKKEQRFTGMLQTA